MYSNLHCLMNMHKYLNLIKDKTMKLCKYKIQLLSKQKNHKLLKHYRHALHYFSENHHTHIRRQLLVDLSDCHPGGSTLSFWTLFSRTFEQKDYRNHKDNFFFFRQQEVEFFRTFENRGNISLWRKLNHAYFPL